MKGYKAYKNPLYIAEISANHGSSLNRVFSIIDHAVYAGANAIKLQTFTADTITLKSNHEDFQIKGNAWEGKSLYELYQNASLPWHMHHDIFDYCSRLGVVCFSTPFDFTAVDFLEEIGTPWYKIASSELVDTPLIEYVAQTKKPTIISTGMGSKKEISDAVESFLKFSSLDKLTLLKCTAEYPASPLDANLLTLNDLQKTYRCDVGLSDHTLTPYASLAAIGLGASVIEKHITDSRKIPGPDSHFSLEPNEFAEMINMSKKLLETFGKVTYDCSLGEEVSKKYRKSLFCKKPLKIGDIITSEHVAIVRPASGLAPKNYHYLLGTRAVRDINVNEPYLASDLQ